MTIQLPIIPGTLPPGYCFTTWQQALNDFADNMTAQLEAGMAFYNYGSTAPDPEFRTYPWLRTQDMRWYYYSGDWISPNPEQSPYARRLFYGSLTDLLTYDGGEAGTSLTSSGPMWEEDTAFQGKMPLGVGTLQPSGTAVALGGTGGVDQHALTIAEIPAHVHVYSKWSPDTATDKPLDGPNNDGGYIATDTSSVGGGQAHTNMPPYLALYIIKRTVRVNYRV